MRDNTSIRRLHIAGDRPVWLLETYRTAYVLELQADGNLHHVYWGPKLALDSDYQAFIASPNWPFERTENTARQEYPGWGGIDYDEPGLKVAFTDGVRAVELAYDTDAIGTDAVGGKDGSASIELPLLVITLRDNHYPLRVHLRYRLVPQFDLIERNVTVENQGDRPIDLEQIMSAVWHFPHRDSYQLRTLTGRWGAETQVQNTPVTVGKQVVESRRGHTSHTANPWFGVAAGDTVSETHGEVWFGALAYSGNWKFALEHNDLGHTRLTGGINDFDFRWRLEAGESFTAPVFVGGYSDAGYGQASRLLHDYQLNYVLPKAFARQARPVIYNSWYVTYFDVTEQNQITAAERAAELGVELFVMDDGWFGARKNDAAGLGDWHVDRDKFPNGLGPLIRRVNELDMQFGLWVEPEMVNPDSALYRAHPEWVYHFPNRRRSEHRNQLVLNFARQDVKEYIFRALDQLLGEHNIEYIKWDMNRTFSEPGWPDAPAGREREIWVRHVWGLYEILDRLRANHPQVLFESCSGGGGRVDLGILQRTDHVWTSDNTDPYEYLIMAEGHSMAYAAKTRLMMVTDSQNLSGRLCPLQFRFHASMTGMLGIGTALLNWSSDEMEEAKQQIALYKEIRETIQHGHLYRLRSPRHRALSALQYVHGAGIESVVFLFLHSSRFGTTDATLKLQGLESDAHYRVEGQESLISGVALMKRGLPIALRGDYVSRVIRIRRTD